MFEQNETRLGKLTINDFENAKFMPSSIKMFLDFQSEDCDDIVNDLKGIGEMLNKYLNDSLDQEFHEYNEKKVEGWKWLPRVCFKIFSANTFFYNCVMDRLAHCKNFNEDDKAQINDLMPWLQLISMVLRKSIWRQDEDEPEFQF